MHYIYFEHLREHFFSWFVLEVYREFLTFFWKKKLALWVIFRFFLPRLVLDQLQVMRCSNNCSFCCRKKAQHWLCKVALIRGRKLPTPGWTKTKLFWKKKLRPFFYFSHIVFGEGLIKGDVWNLVNKYFHSLFYIQVHSK